MSEASRVKLGIGEMRAAVARWSLPEVQGPIVGRPTEPERPPDPAERERLEQLERQRQAEGYNRGYEEGLAAGRAAVERRVLELEERVRRLDAILNLLARPLDDLDEEIEQQIVLLALAVGKQIVRREIRIDPGHVIGVIREAVERLPVAARDVRVHLHPDDAAVVRERLSPATGERAWSIVEDPSLSRGGCIVRTDTAQIDARLESRLNAVVSAILGDERSMSQAVLDSPVAEHA